MALNSAFSYPAYQPPETLQPRPEAFCSPEETWPVFIDQILNLIGLIFHFRELTSRHSGQLAVHRGQIHAFEKGQRLIPNFVPFIVGFRSLLIHAVLIRYFGG
jgi:hypothetical protein